MGDPVYCTRASGLAKCFGRERYRMSVRSSVCWGYPRLIQWNISTEDTIGTQLGKCFSRDIYCMNVAVYTNIGYSGVSWASTVKPLYRGHQSVVQFTSEVSTSYVSCVTTTTYKDRAADTHWAVNNGTCMACMQCIQYRWSIHGCNKYIAICSAVHEFNSSKMHVQTGGAL